MHISNYSKCIHFFQLLRRRVGTYILLLLYRFALNIFPSWKRWVELKLLRAGHRRKESTQSKWRKRKHALGCYGRDCRRGIWRGLPAVLETLGHDSGDVKALWSQSIYGYLLLHNVDNTRRHDIGIGRDRATWVSSVISILKVFCQYDLLKSCSGRRNNWEFRLTMYQVYCKKRSLGGWSCI